MLFGEYTGRDTGRGMVGDVLPEVPGLETWPGEPSGGTDPIYQLRAAAGDRQGTSVPGTNQSIRWSGDLTTQIVTGAGALRRPSRTGGAERC